MAEVKRISYRFTRSQRLLKASEYQKTFCKQTKIIGKHWLIFVNDETSRARLGIAISKKVSNLANQRNRLKKICREQFRLNQHNLPFFDMVIIAKKHSASQKSPVLIEDLNLLFKKLSTKKTKE